MSDVQIRPVLTSGDREKFIKFLWKIYEGNEHWVPPLLMDRRKLMDKKKNPFYSHAEAEFYIAERKGEMVGRIAGIVNHNHNKEHGDKVAFFGFFESINDQTVADALFDTAKKFVRERGMDTLRGPMSPSVNDEIGLLVEGFQYSPVILMPYNPPYYADLVERHGFKKAMDLYAYKLSQETFFSERIVRAHDIVMRRHNLTFRSLDMKRFKEEVGRIKDIFNRAWQKNWGAVPMTEAEIDALASDLKPIVVPELVVFAESKGKTIGFALGLPDINVALKYNRSGGLLMGLYHLMTKKKKIKLARIIVLGVLAEYINTGAAGALFYESAARAKTVGFTHGEAGWVLENNVQMNRAAEAMSGQLHKKYRLYDLAI